MKQNKQKTLIFHRAIDAIGSETRVKSGMSIGN